MNQLIQQIRILSTEQLSAVNAWIDANPEAFSRSTLMGEGKSSSLKSDLEIRSSSFAFLKSDNPISLFLHAAMEDGLREYRKRVKKINSMFAYWPVPGAPNTFFGREDIQLLRYCSGEKYVFHHDQAEFENQPEYHRILSTIVYLSDDFDGGGTEFPHKTFKPKPGYALFFPSNWCYPHSGQEIVSGEKRVAVTWWYSIREPVG